MKFNIFKKKSNTDFVTIKSSWNDITVQDMMDITFVLEDEDTEENKINGLICILTGKDFDYIADLPLFTYKELVKRLQFLQTEPKPNKLKKKYVINGTTYVQCADVTKVTTAQFIDYNNYINNKEKDISKLLSVMLIPKGHEYNKGYEIEDVQNDIKSMSYLDAMGISFFLQKQFVAYVMLMLDYSEELLKKSNPTKEQMQMFNQLKQVLKNTGLSLLY